MKELINILSQIPGIRNVSGHHYSVESEKSGKIIIFFQIHKNSSPIILLLGRVMSRNYGGFENYNPHFPAIPTDDNDLIMGGGWKTELSYTDIPESILDGYIHLMIDSGSYKGYIADEQAKFIAENIDYHLKHKNFCDSFGITTLLREEKINLLLGN